MRGATRLATLRRIQRRMAELVPPGVSLADELIADRRAEAAHEAARDATREADVAELRRRGIA